MDERLVTGGMGVALVLVAALACQSGGDGATDCSQDTDCKGGEICSSGSCVPAPRATPAAPPAPDLRAPVVPAEPVAVAPPPLPPPPPPPPLPPPPPPVVAAAPRPGGPCTSAEEATSRTCSCGGGRQGKMFCFGRSLTWSACDCPKPAPKPAAVNPNKRWPCASDADCNAPFRCGFQGNCMML
ncbi:MAG: hypothetical protein KC731_23950 [Myxococcales bacterium]|nr:hypothetical protein [Myxococcales bacterium]